jgi:transposase
MPRDRVGPDLFPPRDRVEVITIASEKTEDHDCHATRWSLDDLARELVNRHAEEAMTRSTIWRVLNEIDLKPHRSVYWLNSHDPQFQKIAEHICRLYVRAPKFHRHGELLICTDEKCGMQILEREHPTQLARPGYPEKRENNYIRHGTRTLIGSFVVATGEVIWDLGQTRTNVDFANHVKHVLGHVHEYDCTTWILDNLNIHWSLELCEVMAAANGRPYHRGALRTGKQRRAFLTDMDYPHYFVYTPKHGSWLNQVELWFSALARRFLKRGEFRSAEEFERRFYEYMMDYNENHAHPYRWTYTGHPLVRDTPFSQTRRQQRRGRAWFGTRPQRFERYVHPPRPYRRSKPELAVNL